MSCFDIWKKINLLSYSVEYNYEALIHEYLQDKPINSLASCVIIWCSKICTKD